MHNTSANKKDFFVMWILCVIGLCLIFPYLEYMGVFPGALSVFRVLFSIVQGAGVFGLICWLSFKVSVKTDLHPFPRRGIPKQTAYLALIMGACVGLTIFFFDQLVFGQHALSSIHPPLWAGALASMYGAVNEEVLLRLFLFTFLYFLVGKCIKIQESNRLIVLWGINILTSLIFGAGHLPAAFKLTAPSSFEVFRIFFLNGIGGLVFGWLYWSRGLWTAIIAHFVADLVLHVFLV